MLRLVSCVLLQLRAVAVSAPVDMNILVLPASPAQLAHVYSVHWPCNAHLPLKHIYGLCDIRRAWGKKKAYFSVSYGSVCLKFSEIRYKLFCK